MGDERIDELLAKVRELDLETWDRIDSDVQITTRDWANIGNKRIFWLMQGVIQDTCKAKKWHHDVCYNEETEKYVALVVPADNETWLDSIEADTAAAAILRAYIQALEAEAAI